LQFKQDIKKRAKT